MSTVAYVERCGKVWRAHWLLADAVRYGSQSGFATMHVAKRFADDREAAVRGGQEMDMPRPVTATMEQWWYPTLDLAPTTLECYAQQYCKHIRPPWGGIPISEISSLAVAGFEKDLRALGLASSTVEVMMTVVRDLLSDAAAEHVIDTAPVLRTGRRRAGRLAPSIAVDLATVQAIRARLKPDALLLVLTAMFTGMRWGEVCGMVRQERGR